MQNPLVSFSIGRPTNRSTARVQQLEWRKFVELFDDPPRSKETHQQYMDLDKQEKDRLKQSNGWFIGAPLRNGRRRNSEVLARTLVTLDFDDGITAEDLHELEISNHPLCKYEFLLHSTRSHTPDDPRLRIILPVTNPIEPEQYEAVTRILTHTFDPSMTAVDPASFRPAQLMYMPTASIDQEYIYLLNEGELLDPPEIFNHWPEWWNHGCLPRSETESPVVKTNQPLADPGQKKGLVGAFCRAYGIDEAVSEFLPEIYVDPEERGGEVRYTFHGASTTHGAINYNDQYLYSWHSTDPCYQMMCSAWDLVRIHRFGHMDGDVDPETSTRKNELPSHKAMSEWVAKLDSVAEVRISDAIDVTAMFSNVTEETTRRLRQAQLEDKYKLSERAREMLGLDTMGTHTKLEMPPYPGSTKPVPSFADWRRNLEMGKGSELKASIHNVVLILTFDEHFRECCQFNGFRNEMVYKRKFDSPVDYIAIPEVTDTTNGDLWDDTHDAILQSLLAIPAGPGRPGYGLNVPFTTLKSALTTVCQQFRFHPVINRFLELPDWDGVERMEKLWIDYMGAPDTPYHRETARLFMVAAVARLFCPGTAFDSMPILMGTQGIRKSTFVSELAFRTWGGEFSAPLDNQQLAVEQMNDKWILEMQEISSLKSSDLRAQKSFLTRRTDNVRLAYAKRAKNYPRQSVFLGTTNEKQYLHDVENRRYWPIEVDVPFIDTEKLEVERDQLWKEALLAYIELWKECGQNESKIHFHLSSEAKSEAKDIQGEAKTESMEDDDVTAFMDWLNDPIPAKRLLSRQDLLDSELDPDTLLEHTVCAPRQLLIEVAGRSANDKDFKWEVIRTGRNMHLIPGWTKYSTWRRKRQLPQSDRLVVKGHGRLKAYVREDATEQEIARRWRLHRKSSKSVL